MTVKLINRTVLAAGYVGPTKQGVTRLTEGLYSLNKRSNVPYVQLIGSGGFKKVFTWGEIAEIPKGQTCTVGNASYHGGDIYINKGEDICNKPSRITIPVRFAVTQFTRAGQPNYVYQAEYPCDVRGARRAYLCMDAIVDPASEQQQMNVFIRGRQQDGSFNTPSSLNGFTTPFGPGVGYLCIVTYSANEELNYIPLGLNANAGDDTRPHNLLSTAEAFLSMRTESDLDALIDWPADGTLFSALEPGWVRAAAPGAMYVVEYE